MTSIEEKTKKIPQENGDSPKSVVFDPETLRKNIKQHQEYRKVIEEFVETLEENIDYGKITMKSKKTGKEYESKPTLLKPGSEKFMGLFKVRATFERDNDTWEMSGKDSGLFCYICRLVNEQGEVVGEGRGAAHKNEKQDIENVAIKIALKRAQTDAVIRAFELSDYFTQDLEDMDTKEESTGGSKHDTTRTSSPSQKAFQDIYKKIPSVKSSEDADGLIEKIDSSQKLSDKQKSYLKDLVRRKVEEVNIDDIPF